MFRILPFPACLPFAVTVVLPDRTTYSWARDRVRCSISRSENATLRSSSPPLLDVTSRPTTTPRDTELVRPSGGMARDAIVHDVDLPSLEYDDEETAYMSTETPSFDADDATLGSTFVIVDEDVSDPDDDDGVGEEDDVSPLVARTALTSATDSRSSSSATGKVKFMDKIREHKSYQKLARIVKKKGLRPVLHIIL